MALFNFGSTNIDIIFKVDHIVRPGETIPSSSLERSVGGKGANQSVGASYAGGERVFHVGKIGEDGRFIVPLLAEKGVDVTFLHETETPTGQALIQVSKEGQNSIVLYGGGNQTFTEEDVDNVLSHTVAGDWVLLQNEINLNHYVIEQSRKQNLKICFNPAPYSEGVKDLPLHLLDILVLNETEAEGLSGVADPSASLTSLSAMYPDTEILITLGKDGVMHMKGSGEVTTCGVWDVPVADTTAAGDTFIGCYVANRSRNVPVRESLMRASMASNITVMREGALPSIPRPEEFTLLDDFPYRDLLLST
ncbi:MAG: ribokinase [Sphaerochaetaceae bacterium]|nr:ribokinase [Sphaerochaetaceae bacterium]